jgi:hypothetical protein
VSGGKEKKLRGLRRQDHPKTRRDREDAKPICLCRDARLLMALCQMRGKRREKRSILTTLGGHRRR